MSSTNTFLKEDLSKAENRINVSMFGLISHVWFREWILSKLGLSYDGIIYPPPNVKDLRPDLVVVSPEDHTTLAWIEIELGTNIEQLQRYRRRLSEPVKAIWGREGDVSLGKADLSLEQVVEFLDNRAKASELNPQVRVNVVHLQRLIENGLNDHRPSSERAPLSPEMKEHWLVKGLHSQLGERLNFTTGKVKPGELRADTVGPQGFSLRAFSKVTSQGSVSLMYMTSGKDELNLPARPDLNDRLPNHILEINSYTSLLQRIGCNIELPSRPERRLDLQSHRKSIEHHMKELAHCLYALASPRP